jgi:hypothetical protein
MTTSNLAGTSTPTDLAHLYRLRNGVRAALALGVAASVAGNVLHAEPTVVGRAIASWSPLALLLTVELISRIPVTSSRLAALRMVSTAVIAGIAAWVSYWHMVSVAARNGESATSAHLLPLSVDGLVVVASVSLVEIAARLRATAAVATEDVVEDQEPDRTQDEDEKREPKRRPATGTAAARVTRLRDKHPEWTLTQIADKAGVSVRTVRRHLNTTVPAGPGPDTGTGPDTADLAA